MAESSLTLCRRELLIHKLCVWKSSGHLPGTHVELLLLRVAGLAVSGER